MRSQWAGDVHSQRNSLVHLTPQQSDYGTVVDLPSTPVQQIGAIGGRNTGYGLQQPTRSSIHQGNGSTPGNLDMADSIQYTVGTPPNSEPPPSRAFAQDTPNEPASSAAGTGTGQQWGAWTDPAHDPSRRAAQRQTSGQWWEASPTTNTAVPPSPWQTHVSSPGAHQFQSGHRTPAFSSPTVHYPVKQQHSGLYGSAQQQFRDPLAEQQQQATWMGGSQQMMRSPLRGPPPSPMQSHFNVYDMKSLSAALATVQPGVGAIARVFQSCSFKPRLPGLTKLVSQLTREGNWQKGLEVFETLSVLGVVPDTTITNAAISACDKGGQWEKAMSVFNQMEQAGLIRDAITYSALISALSKGRQWAIAIDVFNHMSDAGIECDAVTCCSLITALDKGGQWRLAEQVFVQMYADHPQFRMLLQCMDEDHTQENASPAASTSGGAHVGSEANLMGTPEAWSAAGYDDDLAATLAAAARLMGGGATAQQTLQLPSDSAGNTPLASTISRLCRNLSIQQEEVMHALSAGASALPPLTPTPSSPRPIKHRATPDIGGQTSAGGGSHGPASPTTPRSQPPELRPVDSGGTASSDEVNKSGVPTLGDPTIAASSTAAAQMEAFTKSTNDQLTELLMLGSSGTVAAGGRQQAGQGGTAGGTGRGVEADGGDASGVDLLANMMGGLLRQMSSSIPHTPVSPAPGQGVPTWADLQQQVAADVRQQLISTLVGAPSNASTVLSGLGPTGAQQLMMSPGFGAGCLTSPSRCNSMLSRTMSGPPGTPRGLLRTSSLNVKKAAPNRVCCNALLAAYARAVPTQWQRALRLLDLMWQCGGEMQPDIVSYNTVIKAVGNAQQVALGFQVYQLMCSRGIEPTVATYGTLICIAADVGASALVKEAWHWLRASGLDVHVTAANAYLSALIKEGEWAEAQGLLSSMLSNMGPCRPNAVTFSVMSAAYLAKGEAGAIKQLYHQLCAAGVQPSPNTLGQLVCVLASKGMWEDALSILASVCRSDAGGAGLRPFPGVFTHVFCALRDAAWRAFTNREPGARQMLAAKLNETKQLLKSQQGLICHPDVSLYRAMVGASAAVGDADMCVELFNSMVASRLPIDEDVAATVLGALCEQRSWSRVVQLVTALQNSCREGAGVSARVLLQALAPLDTAGAWTRAYQVLKAARSVGVGGWVCLLDTIKSAGASDLLLLGLLADKEATGAWADALCLFTWQQALSQGSRLTQSPEAYSLMIELLYVHGRTEGLRQAVLLVKSGHEQGVLHYYALPAPLLTSKTGKDPENTGQQQQLVRSPGSSHSQDAPGQAATDVHGQKDDDDEAAQQQGERMASVVANAALDTVSELLSATCAPSRTPAPTAPVSDAGATAGDAAPAGKVGLGEERPLAGAGSVVGEGGAREGVATAADGRTNIKWPTVPGLADAPAGLDEFESSVTRTTTPGQGTPGQLEAGAWVALPGPTGVQALVVLLAWISTLADAARDHGHFVSGPCGDILILVPFTDMEATELMMGYSPLQGEEDVEIIMGVDSLRLRPTLAQFRRIVSVVLEGGYLSLLQGPGEKVELTREQQKTLVLRPPGVLYWPDPNNPGLVHVNIQSLYQAIASCDPNDSDDAHSNKCGNGEHSYVHMASPAT